MKWAVLLVVVVWGYIGVVQHTNNEESIKQTTKELLDEIGYGSFRIEGINLPLSYTLLSQKVVSEVFVEKNGENTIVKITVTPIESYPLVSVITPPSYYVEIDPTFHASEFLKRLLRN